MKLAVLRETCIGERRVGLVPAHVPQITKAGVEVVVESGAGVEAGLADEAYVQKGARIVATRADAIAASDSIIQVRAGGSNRLSGVAEFSQMRADQVVIGL